MYDESEEETEGLLVVGTIGTCVKGLGNVRAGERVIFDVGVCGVGSFERVKESEETSREKTEGGAEGAGHSAGCRLRSSSSLMASERPADARDDSSVKVLSGRSSSRSFAVWRAVERVCNEVGMVGGRRENDRMGDGYGRNGGESSDYALDTTGALRTRESAWAGEARGVFLADVREVVLAVDDVQSVRCSKKSVSRRSGFTDQTVREQARTVSL